MITFNKKLTAFFIAVLSCTSLGATNLYALEDSAEAVGVFDWIPLRAGFQTWVRTKIITFTA